MRSECPLRRSSSHFPIAAGTPNHARGSRALLERVGFKLFLLDADDVFIHLLTDSGTGAMPARVGAHGPDGVLQQLQTFLELLTSTVSAK